MLKQGQRSAHISTKLKEFISSCREFDGDGRLLLSLAALIHRLGLNFWELFQVDVHPYVYVEGFAGALCRVLGTWSTRCKQVAHWVVHVDDLADSQGVDLKLSRDSLLLLIEDFDERVGVLDGHTHLEQILGEDLVWDNMADRLSQKELNEGQHYPSLSLVEILVTA